MLLGERDTYNCNGKYQRRNQMCHSDLPPEENQPDQVEENAKGTVRVLPFHHLLAKWGEGCYADLYRLQTEGNADDSEAEKKTADQVSEGGDEASKDKPNDIAERTHAGFLYWIVEFRSIRCSSPILYYGILRASNDEVSVDAG